MVVSAFRGPLWGFCYFCASQVFQRLLVGILLFITYCLVALPGDFVRIWACDDSEAFYGDPVDPFGFHLCWLRKHF